MRTSLRRKIIDPSSNGMRSIKKPQQLEDGSANEVG